MALRHLDKKRQRDRMLAAVLFLALVFFAGVSAGLSHEAPVIIRVIAPSRPHLDRYFPLWLEAWKDGQPHHNFTGHLWLWTDGPHMRPYHVFMAAENRGVVGTRARTELSEITRVEAYAPGAEYHGWSNPIFPRSGEKTDATFKGPLPVIEKGRGPGLYWGGLPDSIETFLDFRIGKKHERMAALPVVERQVDGESWILVLDPSLSEPDRQGIADSLGGGGQDDFYLALAQAGNRVVPMVHTRPPSSWWKSAVNWASGIVFEKTAAPRPIVIMRADADLKPVIDGYAGAEGFILSGPGCRIGLWAESPEPALLFESLQKGRLISACQGRPLLYLVPGEVLKLAGQGPSELVRLWCPAEDGMLVSTLASSSDYLLEVPLPPDVSGCYLEIVEPGSDLPSRALAGPL